MSARDTKVDTIARLARWKIESLSYGYPYNYKKSDPFKMGIWNWHLAVDMNSIKVFPEHCEVSQPPLARFIIRVTTSGPNRKQLTSPIQEKLLRTAHDFAWHVDANLLIGGHFMVDVEFLNLKINGSKESSIWPSECTDRQHIPTPKCISRLLKESIHTDVTINASDGELRAHKAILCLSSPVFEGMFKHDLKETASSTVDIQDMSYETCMAMLSFMYGSINPAEFWKSRMALLGAADKYDVVGLKDACERSLLEDISAENVLERLQEAWLYSLAKLKKGCLVYLLQFGKIYDVNKDKMRLFFRQADRELVEELFQGLLLLSKPA